MREGSPPPTCHVSNITCHVSNITCHVSHIICHMSRVICQVFFFFFFSSGQRGETSWWMVCCPKDYPVYFITMVIFYKNRSKSFIKNLLRRLQSQTLPDATPPIGKIHPFSRVTLTFEPMIQISYPLRFRDKIRSILEQACVVWHLSILKRNERELERVQKVNYIVNHSQN